jgi:hypothetical protein
VQPGDRRYVLAARAVDALGDLGDAGLEAPLLRAQVVVGLRGHAEHGHRERGDECSGDSQRAHPHAGGS